MKFFHLSDLHIGIKLYNRDLVEDQQYIFDQIAALAEREQPDAIVIAGDVYDKAVPSAEAVVLFDRFLARLIQAAPEAEIMVISGNHDSAPRINAFRGVLQRQRIHMIGMPPQLPEERIEKRTLQDAYGDVHFYLLPFVRPGMVRAIVDADGEGLSYNEALHRLISREAIDPTARNVLVSHQFYLPCGANADGIERMESEIRTVGNIDSVDASVLSRFDYAALGHIHKPMKVGNECLRYCGTPLAYSVSEAGQQKGVIMVEMTGKGCVKTQVLPLSPLRQLRVISGSLEEVLQQGCEDYVSVLLTDRVDLDVIDMRDRMRRAFPRLLEIRREQLRTADYQAEYTPEADLDPFALCKRFLKDLDGDEQQLLQNVINSVRGVQE